MDYWDGITDNFDAYKVCTCAGSTDVTRSSGKFNFWNTYGSQWTGPNWDNTDDVPMWRDGGYGLKPWEDYILEVRYRDYFQIKTRLTMSFNCSENNWGNCEDMEIYPTELYQKEDGSYAWRETVDNEHFKTNTGVPYSTFVSVNDSQMQSAKNVTISGTQWAWQKFRIKTKNIQNLVTLRIALQYGECYDADQERMGSCSGGAGCDNGGGSNTCSTQWTWQHNHGTQRIEMDRINITKASAIGGWDRNFSRESEVGFSATNESGNVSIDSTYVNYAVGLRGLRFNTKGTPVRAAENTDNMGVDTLRSCVTEFEGFGAPLPPHNGQPVQGILAVKPRQDLLYREATNSDTGVDTDDGYGVENDPMIIDAPTLVYDTNNYLRGFLLLEHFWNYDIAHRWKVQWKLYLPVDYIIDNDLQAKTIGSSRYGMQIATADGKVAFDSRLETLEPTKGYKVMNSYDCCTTTNSGIGSRGQIYEWDEPIGSCNGNGYDDDSDYRADYDSHPFYIPNSVSANNLVKNRNEYMMQGVATPEAMYRLSTSGYFGEATFGCAFDAADEGMFGAVPGPSDGCQGYNFSMGDSINDQQKCQLNMWGIGAPFHMVAVHNGNDHNNNSYLVAANTMFVLEDFMEEHMHGVSPDPQDTDSLDEGLERYTQMMVGNGWKLEMDQSTNGSGLHWERALYFKDIDGGFSTTPWNVDYSNNPDAYLDDGTGNPAGVGFGGMLGWEHCDDEDSLQFEWGYVNAASTKHDFYGINQDVYDGVSGYYGNSGSVCSGAECMGTGDHKVCAGHTNTNTRSWCTLTYGDNFANNSEAWDKLCCEMSCSQTCTPDDAPLGKTFTYNVWVKVITKNTPAPRYWLINASRTQGQAEPYETRALCQRPDYSWKWCATGHAIFNHYHQSNYPY
tara:strand:+ start:652 stop:3351 length:2700 start_codon:yes stop_codon:yes gene_type:complete